MKGLLYKDIVTNRGNIFAMLFLLYAIIGCMVLVLWGDNDKLGVAAVVTVPVGCIFVLNICIPIISMVTGVTDHKTKWTKYALALPGGYKRIVQEKYAICIIGQAIGILLSAILILAIKLKLDIAWKVLSIYAIPVVIGVGVFSLATAIMLPVILKKENIAEKIGIVIFILAIVGVEIYICFGNIEIFQNDDLIIKVILWFLNNMKKVWLIAGGIALAGMLVEYASYKLTVRTFLSD